MSYESVEEIYRKKDDAVRFDLIESEELKSLLREHGESLKSSEVRFPLMPGLLFADHARAVAKSTNGQGIERYAVENSIINLIVRSFDSLLISRDEAIKQVSEISESEFLEATEIFYWTLGVKFGLEDYSSRLILDTSTFYFSYALTLISARELLLITLEMNKWAQNGEDMNFEKLLFAVKRVAASEYRDQPIEWLLQIA